MNVAPGSPELVDSIGIDVEGLGLRIVKTANLDPGLVPPSTVNQRGGTGTGDKGDDLPVVQLEPLASHCSGVSACFKAAHSGHIHVPLKLRNSFTGAARTAALTRNKTGITRSSLL